jgi:hypothetical protein
MGLLKLQIFLPSGVETASQFDEFSMWASLQAVIILSVKNSRHRQFAYRERKYVADAVTEGFSAGRLFGRFSKDFTSPCLQYHDDQLLIWWTLCSLPSRSRLNYHSIVYPKKQEIWSPVSMYEIGCLHND